MWVASCDRPYLHGSFEVRADGTRETEMRFMVCAGGIQEAQWQDIRAKPHINSHLRSSMFWGKFLKSQAGTWKLEIGTWKTPSLRGSA
eukprot:1254103-Amphidinium_carterae.1